MWLRLISISHELRNEREELGLSRLIGEILQWKRPNVYFIWHKEYEEDWYEV